MERFKLSHELSFITVPSYIKHMQQRLLATSKDGLCLDLSDVQQCDSAGLALLIEAKRICNQCQLTFTIEGMSANIYALAEFCGVKQILAI